VSQLSLSRIHFAHWQITRDNIQAKRHRIGLAQSSRDNSPPNDVKEQHVTEHYVAPLPNIVYRRRWFLQLTLGMPKGFANEIFYVLR
jgi:hypothetical protein